MTWLRVDDGALTHPKVMRLRSLGSRTAVPDLAEAVIGFVVLASTWSGQHNTDCLILESVGPLASPSRWLQLSDAAIAVGILTSAPHPSGEAAWLVDISDRLFHLLSKAEVEINRDRRNAPRRNAARVAVLLRDGDQCRYCKHTVNPFDSTWGGWGRHFEHPDPSKPDDVVVACARCNQTKADRTDVEAGMVLHPPPDEKYWHPKTLEWLYRQGCTEADGIPPLGTTLRPPAGQPDDPAAAPADVPDTPRPAPGQAAEPEAPGDPAPSGNTPTALPTKKPRRKRTATPRDATRAATSAPARTHHPPDPPSDPPTPGSAEPPSAGTGRDGTGRVGQGRAAGAQAAARRKRARRGGARRGGS